MRLSFATVLFAASVIAAAVIPSEYNAAMTPNRRLDKRQCPCDCVSFAFFLDTIAQDRRQCTNVLCPEQQFMRRQLFWRVSYIHL
jgi:hypothetical protein